MQLTCIFPLHLYTLNVDKMKTSAFTWQPQEKEGSFFSIVYTANPGKDLIGSARAICASPYSEGMFCNFVQIKDNTFWGMIVENAQQTK